MKKPRTYSSSSQEDIQEKDDFKPSITKEDINFLKNFASFTSAHLNNQYQYTNSEIEGPFSSSSSSNNQGPFSSNPVDKSSSSSMIDLCSDIEDSSEEETDYLKEKRKLLLSGTQIEKQEPVIKKIKQEKDEDIDESSSSSSSSSSDSDSDSSSSSEDEKEEKKVPDKSVYSGLFIKPKPTTPLPAVNFVPLRQKDSSQLNMSQVYTKPVESNVDSNLWKNRLWPNNSSMNFLKAIMLHEPLREILPGSKVTKNSSKPILKSLFNPTDFGKIKTFYEDENLHYRHFYMMIIEECRSMISNSDDSFTNFTMFEDLWGIMGTNTDSDKWVSAEIDSIVCESPISKLQSPLPSKLSQMIIVNLAISFPDDVDPVVIKKYEKSLVSGDLFVCRSNDWSKPALAIVSPWDPENDVKASYRSTTLTKKNTFYLNFVICLDHESHIKEPAGGWFLPNQTLIGLSFQMYHIGNVLTSLRECQSIEATKYMKESLKSVVFLSQKLSPSILSLKEELAKNLPQGSSEGISSFVGPIEGPKNVPKELWKQLCNVYNESQIKALRMICSRNLNDTDSASPICLLQGPPGTGKTKTILGILSVLLNGALDPIKKTVNTSKIVAGSSFKNTSVTRKDITKVSKIKRRRILVCAPSNTAIDELIYRIIKSGVWNSEGKRNEHIKVVRIGYLSKDEYNQKNRGILRTTDGKMKKGGIKKEDYDIINVVEKVSLDYLVEMKKKTLASATTESYYKNLEARREILEDADIVCATLSGSGSQLLLEVLMKFISYQFDAVVIDEAAQAVEPSCLIPFKYNPQLTILVGDQCQLPATVVSNQNRELGFSQSLFSRLMTGGIPTVMLETQYRMHPNISSFPSKRFYKGLLKDSHSVLYSGSHNKPYHKEPSKKFMPFVFHNLLTSSQEIEGASIKNYKEAEYILNLYESLINSYPNEQPSVGIIAPYRAQRNLLMNLFTKRFINSPRNISVDIEISTVDGFQGREKDIIIFSCVRASNSGGASIGFLKEWQRLNVAITRAKYALWVVGHEKTLIVDSEWRSMIEHAKKTDSFIDVQKYSKNENESNDSFTTRDSQNNTSSNHRSNNNYYRDSQRESNRDSQRDSYRDSQRDSYRDSKRDSYRESYKFSNSRPYERSNNIPPPPPPPPIPSSYYPHNGLPTFNPSFPSNVQPPLPPRPYSNSYPSPQPPPPSHPRPPSHYQSRSYTNPSSTYRSTNHPYPPYNNRK